MSRRDKGTGSKEEALERRLAMNAYLAYVDSGRKRGLFFAPNIEGEMAYITDRDAVRHLSTKMTGIEEVIRECFDRYDDDYQVLLLYLIGGKSYIVAAEYTQSEATKWVKHIDCFRMASGREIAEDTPVSGEASS